MTISKHFFLKEESSTLRLAERLSKVLGANTVIYLYGDLGAGKTCFCRGLLQSLGVKGRVKSPTFTLVEPYTIQGLGEVLHFDFYRLNDMEEALYLGLEDCEHAYLCLMEWPDKASGYIPEADISIALTYNGKARDISLEGVSPKGCKIVSQLT